MTPAAPGAPATPDAGCSAGKLPYQARGIRNWPTGKGRYRLSLVYYAPPAKAALAPSPCVNRLLPTAASRRLEIPHLRTYAPPAYPLPPACRPER